MCSLKTVATTKYHVAPWKPLQKTHSTCSVKRAMELCPGRTNRAPPANQCESWFAAPLVPNPQSSHKREFQKKKNGRALGPALEAHLNAGLWHHSTDIRRAVRGTAPPSPTTGSHPGSLLSHRTGFAPSPVPVVHRATASHPHASGSLLGSWSQRWTQEPRRDPASEPLGFLTHKNKMGPSDFFWPFPHLNMFPGPPEARKLQTHHHMP